MPKGTVVDHWTGTLVDLVTQAVQLRPPLIKLTELPTIIFEEPQESTPVGMDAISGVAILQLVGSQKEVRAVIVEPSISDPSKRVELKRSPVDWTNPFSEVCRVEKSTLIRSIRRSKRTFTSSSSRPSGRLLSYTASQASYRHHAAKLLRSYNGLRTTSTKTRNWF